jgi:SRSO17 transposase
MAAQTATKQEEVVIIEKLATELERLTEWLEPHLRRREEHEVASNYVKALLSRAERKNTWGLSQEAGKEAPYSFQHLLLGASWDESTVRDDVLTYARQSLGEGGVLAVDETGFLKKGDKSASVARQCTRTAGRIENSQVGVFIAYVTPQGHTLVDRELYLPEEWAQDSGRRLTAGIPEEVALHMARLAKGQLRKRPDSKPGTAILEFSKAGVYLVDEFR